MNTFQGFTFITQILPPVEEHSVKFSYPDWLPLGHWRHHNCIHPRNPTFCWLDRMVCHLRTCTPRKRRGVLGTLLSTKSWGPFEAMGILRVRWGLARVAHLPCDRIRGWLGAAESCDLQQLESDCGWTRGGHWSSQVQNKHTRSRKGSHWCWCPEWQCFLYINWGMEVQQPIQPMNKQSTEWKKIS